MSDYSVKAITLDSRTSQLSIPPMYTFDHVRFIIAYVRIKMCFICIIISGDRIIMGWVCIIMGCVYLIMGGLCNEMGFTCSLSKRQKRFCQFVRKNSFPFASLPSLFMYPLNMLAFKGNFCAHVRLSVVNQSPKV